MTKVDDLHRKWMKDPKYRKAHEDLAPEFELAHAVIDARVHARRCLPFRLCRILLSASTVIFAMKQA
jgi:hypothetical protein